MFEAASEFFRRYKRKKKMLLKNTFDVLRPIKFLSHITGFRVFEYPQGHPRPRLSFLYMILLCITYCIGWYTLNFMDEPDEEYNIQKAIYEITDVTNNVGMFLVLIVGWHQSKSLKLSVKRIHEVDVTLQALGSSRYMNVVYKKMIGIMTFVFLMLFFFIILHIIAHILTFRDIYTTFTVISVIFLRFYSQIVEYILIMEFFLVISCIDSEFERANDLLGDINVLPLSSIAMELLDRKNSKDSFSTNKSFVKTSSKLFTILPHSQQLRSHLQMTSHEIIRTRRLLQTIRQVHLELYRVSKRISIIYGIQTAIEMSLCILCITYFIYTFYCLYDIAKKNITVFIVSFVGTSVVCFNNFMKIFIINYICEKTSQKVQRANEIIYTFYGQNKDSELQEEMEMFSLQMMHCQLVYSAAGLYSLNYKTICGCVGITATYVVIMIQVANSLLEEAVAKR